MKRECEVIWNDVGNFWTYMRSPGASTYMYTPLLSVELCRICPYQRTEADPGKVCHNTNTAGSLHWYASALSELVGIAVLKQHILSTIARAAAAMKQMELQASVSQLLRYPFLDIVIFPIPISGSGCHSSESECLSSSGVRMNRTLRKYSNLCRTTSSSTLSIQVDTEIILCDCLSVFMSWCWYWANLLSMYY